MKIGVMIAMMFSSMFLGAAEPLDADWAAVDKALSKQQPRTAVATLEQIEAKAAETRQWSDLAAAIIRRAQLEYGYTEESALKKEGHEGLVAKFVEKVEKSPAEVRPMLRLVVAHGYRRLAQSMRHWHANRTKLEDAASTNQPPWSAERLRPSLRELLAKIRADAPVLQAEKPADWKRLLGWCNQFGDEVQPTLFDFAIDDLVAVAGGADLIDHDANGAPAGLSAELLAALDARIAFHAAGGNPHALAHAKLAKIDFLDAATEGRPKEKLAKRIAALEALTKEFFETSWMSGVAAARLGSWRETDEKTDLAQLHDWYLGFARKWPKTPGGNACRERAEVLECPSFSVETERNWCAPMPDIEVTCKNLTKATFRLVKLDVDDLADHDDFDMSPSNYEGYLKKYFARKVVKEWTVDLPPHADYREHEYRFPAPADLPKGHYALFATGNDSFEVKTKDGKPILVQFVTMTGLALVTAENESGRLRGYLLDADLGTPVAGAKVELWARDRRKFKCFDKVKTAADGAFSFVAEDRWGCYLRAVKGDDEVISKSVNLRNFGTRSAPNLNHVDLVTDRTIYRPGQVVKFKGFAFHCDADQNDYRVMPDTRVFVTFCDPNDKKVAQLALMSNAFGSFSGEFIAPRDLLTGAYTLRCDLRASPVATTTARVQVEEYKRPKFTVKLNPTKDEKLGAETTVTGIATTYTGLPVPEAEVEWRVVRSAVYPRWWCWSCPNDDEPVFASGKAKTDAKGEFRFAFTPTPSETVDLDGDPSFRFEVNADVTDGTGESHAANRSFEVGMVPWRATVNLKEHERWQTPAQPVGLAFALRTLNGEPVANVKGTVKVFALKGPDRVVRPPTGQNNFGRWGGWHRRQDKPSSVKLWDPNTWPNGEMVGEFALTTNEKGTAEIAGAKLAPGMYRAEYQVTAPDGKRVKDLCTWRVVDPADEGHAIKEPAYAKLEQATVPVGGLARFYWGTGYDSACCRVIVRQGTKVLLEEVKRDRMFCLDLPITPDMVGQLEIATLFVRENRIMTERACLYVPRPDCRLKINREHFTSKLLPGAKETWSFTVSGADADDLHSGVEMLAFMYDRSLDAFMSHWVELPFDRYFGRSVDYLSWSLHNKLRGMENWQGHWPYAWGGSGLSLRGWRMDVDSIFSVGNAVFRAPGRGRPMRKMMAVAGLAPVEDEEVMACKALPAMEAPMGMMMSKDRMAEAPAAKAMGGGKRKEKKSEAGDASAEVAPRRNLAETAFFLPHLTSDEKGAVTFSFTVPEALTGWKFTALAHDAQLRGGSLRDDTVVTTKPLMAEPVAPRFVREGDRFRFPVKVTNTEDAPQSGKATLAFFDAESGQEAKLVAGEVDFALGAKETKTVEFAVEIPDGCGCLRYVAKAKGQEFTDGEEGFLPVLSKRIEVRESLPLQIKKGGVKSATFKELAASGESKTLRHAGLAVQVVSDPTWYAFLALPYLMEYPHECCEQVFGRFYANALAQHVARSRPAYREVFEAWEQLDAKALKSPLELNEDLKQIALDATPWVNEAADETKAKRHIGELFGSARLAGEQRRAVAKLEQNFNGGDDLWPWFPGGPGSAWVTMHILTGYARLDRLVKDKNLVEKPSVLVRARRGLDAEMVEDVDKRLAWIKKHGGEFHLSSMDLRWLYLQSFDGGTSKHRDLLMKHLRKEWVDFGIAGQSLGALVLMRAGEEELARTIVKSLKERAVRSEEFGLYWKRSPLFDCSLFAAPVCDQALAMEAFLEVTPEDHESYEDARLWMLEQKRTQNWSTTVSTVDAVYAILLDNGGKARVSAQDEDVVVVRLGGEELPREGAEAGTGFYEHRFDPAKITARLGEIELERKEDKLGWASLNWTYLEDVTKVKVFEQTGLRLAKTYFKKTLVAGKVRLVALGGGEPLRPGDELVARLTIDSDRVYEYAHLRDERPASAEPVDVLSRYRWQDGLGFYQSTRDTATHYYFDRLPKGNFVLETSFRVRQQGVFTSGIASLQCMYAPEFGAHSNASIIEVKK